MKYDTSLYSAENSGDPWNIITSPTQGVENDPYYYNSTIPYSEIQNMTYEEWTSFIQSNPGCPSSYPNGQNLYFENYVLLMADYRNPVYAKVPTQFVMVSGEHDAYSSKYRGDINLINKQSPINNFISINGKYKESSWKI